MEFLSKEYVKEFYEKYYEHVTKAKEELKRPLTFTEKILFAHTSNRRGQTIPLKVDRVAMQDATAQMAILQFMTAGKKTVAVPTTIHCDHLIRAHSGADEDLHNALLENNEVYSFLHSAANKYGMGFWKPGSGIIHQVLLENYAMPGTLMIGTDSHTPNAGGLSMIAIGVGGADAVDAMVGEEWRIPLPKRIGIQLTGRLSGWTAPKDVILKVADMLTVKGGTGYILEYFGEGCKTISATGKATITNMGAEVGATTSLFPYDNHSAEYLKATKREHVAETANNIQQELRADYEIEQNPEAFFDKVIRIDLTTLEPHVVGPHSPDLARPISKLKEDIEQNGWPLQLSASLIGSCTNSSYEDMSRAASIAQQAAERGMKAKIPFLITPGSQQIHKTIERDGQKKIFQNMGGIVLANACGPCIGQWQRDEIQKGDHNSIITSYNRNFKKRNDANPQTHAFIASPEIVTALSLAGTLSFNPLRDPLLDQNGDEWFLKEPQGNKLPKNEFVFDYTGYAHPTGEGKITVNPESERVALLKPFSKWNVENDFKSMPILVKALGKCTTDHISPAGKWLKYRGHLENISRNMFSGAVNAFTQEVGAGTNMITGEKGKEFHITAQAYKKEQKHWMAIGDTNYGEGSSREHAAMEPRHLGCAVVLAKSFARIAETNLKKQGILVLQFVNPDDYKKIGEEDRITVPPDQLEIEVGKSVILTIEHAADLSETIETSHSFSSEQIAWFKAGSALNWIREK